VCVCVCVCVCACSLNGGDSGTAERWPNRVGDCVSVVFLFQCMHGRFDQLNS
jgi:hypothetical protein